MPDRATTASKPKGRALVLTADLPWPADGGGRIATLQILESLTRIFEVDLISMADPTGEPDLAYLRSICRSVEVVRVPFTFGRHKGRQLATLARSLLSTEPYRLRKFRSGEFERAVRARLEAGEYELLHCDQFGAAPYMRLAAPTIATTLAHQNVESEIYRLAARHAANPIRRLVAEVERRKLRGAEKTLLGGFDQVMVLAGDDAVLLDELGVTRTALIPMAAPQGERRLEKPPTEPRIVSIGTMSWYGVADGLLWFHREVYPLIRQRVPAARWELIGSNAPSSILRLADDPAISVAGYIPDLSGTLASARAGIVPLFVAGGVRMKLLDFMSWGLPSVATSLAARGLDFPDGTGCFRRDRAEDFAEAVVRLLTDDAAWTETAARGRAYVVASHSPAARDAAVRTAVDRAVMNRNLRTRATVASGSPSTPAVVAIDTLQIQNVAAEEADLILQRWLDEAREGRSPSRGRYACTPNVDYVVRAGRDPVFRRAINSADLRVPDGMWIVYASRLAGRPLRGTVTGRLLLPRFAAHCASRGLSLGLLGAGPGVAQEAALRLRKENPGLTIDPAITPPMPFVVGSPEDEAIMGQLKMNPPAMLFVSLGAPKQELWMERHSAELPATVMVGVGAALDVVAGRVREAPSWMTRVGLEWLFRLIQEPRRLARRYLHDDPSILIWAIRTRMGRTRAEERRPR